MRRLLPLITLIFAALVAIPPAAAQTPAAEPMEGLEYIAVRQYAHDPASPVAPGDEGVFVLTIRVYTFESEAHANEGWDSTVDSTAIENDIGEAAENVTFSEDEVEDLGDRAWVTTLSAEVADGETGYFRLIYVQEGEMLYTVNAIAGSEDAALITDDLARAMVESEPGDSDVAFNPDGTSTGGVWEIIPSDGDDLLDDLAPFADGELSLQE